MEHLEVLWKLGSMVCAIVGSFLYVARLINKWQTDNRAYQKKEHRKIRKAIEAKVGKDECARLRASCPCMTKTNSK